MAVIRISPALLWRRRIMPRQGLLVMRNRAPVTLADLIGIAVARVAARVQASGGVGAGHVRTLPRSPAPVSRKLSSPNRRLK
jgi:hypothetical protein